MVGVNNVNNVPLKEDFLNLIKTKFHMNNYVRKENLKNQYLS